MNQYTKRYELEKAIDRVYSEWCKDCNHRPNEERHCDLEDFRKHCAIANLIYVVEKNE